MNEGISDTLMTVDEVSDYLRLAQSTVYKLANEGKLPARKFGGSWRISRRALDEWIEGSKKKDVQNETNYIGI